ncbi:hypothetical protein Taro_010943 [Colocasia esculenta]|uniref:CMP-sialic acid transporter 1 n=1 Tax=Colocasia esculenta TaxID=4460 RepID=A0A843U4H4_COLES|nr:hypothetical protein [Colocasia esculenta]
MAFSKCERRTGKTNNWGQSAVARAQITGSVEERFRHLQLSRGSLVVASPDLPPSDGDEAEEAEEEEAPGCGVAEGARCSGTSWPRCSLSSPARRCVRRSLIGDVCFPGFESSGHRRSSLDALVIQLFVAAMGAGMGGHKFRRIAFLFVLFLQLVGEDVFLWLGASCRPCNGRIEIMGLAVVGCCRIWGVVRRREIRPGSVVEVGKGELGHLGASVEWSEFIDGGSVTLHSNNGNAGILTTLSQSNGGYKYDYATVPFLAEVFKLLVSSILLWRECKSSHPPRMTTDWKSIRLFPIPSVIYLIHNNVQFATLTYVDTSTYQIMGNLKIVTTGILFRLFLRRKLSNLQWMAIIFLTVGTTTSQVKSCGETSCDSIFSAPIQGYMLGVLSACLSALAGVYTEFLMKKNNDSLYWQNVQLYTFGAIFNMLRLLGDDFRVGFEKGPWWQRLFYGYTITTWMVVLNLGSTGLLVSWLMKYADNIVKVYSTSMAMLLTMVLSIFLFNFRPTLQLFLGIIICMMSLHMYFAPANMLVDLPTSKAMPEPLKEVAVERAEES